MHATSISLCHDATWQKIGNAYASRNLRSRSSNGSERPFPKWQIPVRFRAGAPLFPAKFPPNSEPQIWYRIWYHIEFLEQIRTKNNQRSDFENCRRKRNSVNRINGKIQKPIKTKMWKKRLRRFRKLKHIRANDSKSGHTLAKSDASFDTVFFNW